VPDVVGRSSNLVTVPEAWTESILPDDQLRPLRFRRVRDGVDRWHLIDRRAFFDDAPAAADLDEEDHRGVNALGRVDDIGLLCVPDLFWQWRQEQQPAPPEEVTYGTGAFEPCSRQDTTAPVNAAVAPETWLDPTIASERDEIVARQLRVLDVAGFHRRFVALLDVPRGLPAREIAGWRAQFDSDFAACYHPWLGVPDPGPLGLSHFVPPSAFAAGIIAGREIRLGVHRGPANELAARTVDVSSAITDVVAAELFGQAVNVFRPERDGFRLQSARTLSTDPQYLQLSVRRLMTSIMLSLQRIGDRLVFEPNNQDLRAVLVQTISGLLGDFHRRGAFAGATEAASFFVRCDDSLNTSQTAAQGQLIAEVGVAPAAPLEFIVVRIVQNVDGRTAVSERE
jgi:phage tail sheath protein FI